MSQSVRFDRIVPEGKAMGRLADGRAVFCIGPLPGETASVHLRKQKRTFAEAVLHHIIDPSPRRTGPAETHHLTCSPWQGVDYAYQLDLKRRMLSEALRQQKLSFDIPPLVGSPLTDGYRNRLDFALIRQDGRLSLAFHRRGSWQEFEILAQGCTLGSPEMNAAALNLTDQLGPLLEEPDGAVITVRHARSTGQLLTILTTASDANWDSIDTTQLGTFVVARPLPGSGAPGPLQFASGEGAITEHIRGLSLSYPYDSFFQTNTPVFELALERIVQASAGGHQAVELYSGVGAIGLALAAQGVAVHGVESVASSVEYAQRNAIASGLTHYTAEAVAAERMGADLMTGADTVILDPPRAGLHPRVLQWLLAAKPERTIYLSCNPVTQARDVAALAPAYGITAVTGFDMYPHTLHLESLMLLTRA